jgi:hypothetical protein
MRSSPNFLVVNRSEDQDDGVDRGHSSPINIRLPGRSNDDWERGLDIHISVSYKTLLIVFALFNVLSRIVTALVDSQMVHNFLGR